MIPPWEAFKMKKPVIYSSLPGVKEVYHDCVNYIDPFNHEDIAKNIIQVSENSELRNNLISKGVDGNMQVVKTERSEPDADLKRIAESKIEDLEVEVLNERTVKV